MRGTAVEKQRLVRSSNIKAGIGFLLILGSIFVPLLVDEMRLPAEVGLIAALAVRLVGIVLWIWGLRHYAMSKGYHPAWGFLGLLSIIGLLILVVLPNKYVVAADEPEGHYPRSGDLY